MTRKRSRPPYFPKNPFWLQYIHIAMAYTADKLILSKKWRKQLPKIRLSVEQFLGRVIYFSFSFWVKSACVLELESLAASNNDWMNNWMMNDWMNNWMNEWKNDWMNDWMNNWMMNNWMNNGMNTEWTIEWTIEWWTIEWWTIEWWMNECIF